MQLIDGKQIAQQVHAETRAAVEALQAHGITPGLAVVLVGEDPASKVYVKNKHASTVEVGMNSYEHRLDAATLDPAVISRYYPKRDFHMVYYGEILGIFKKE